MGPSNMQLDWATKALDQLDTHELFELLKLRQEVFVVEQDCPYPDIDDTDRVAMHLCGWSEKKLVAYARLIKPGVSYTQASIGRVVVSPAARGAGLGQTLMEEALKQTERLYPAQPIKIGAQQPLENFYNDLGFKRTSEMYLEDGIPHIHMLRN